MRGALGSLFQGCFTLGVFTSHWVTYGASKMAPSTRQWRIPAGLQLLFSGLLSLSMLFTKESTRWLAKVGRHDDALKSLVWVRGGEYDYEIQAWRIILVITLQIGIQLTGNTSLAYFAPQFFAAIGAGDNAMFMSGFFDLCKVVACFAFLLFLVERIGRRWALLNGTVFMAILVLIVAVITATEPPTGKAGLTKPASAAICMIYTETMAYNIPWGPVPYEFASAVVEPLLSTLRVFFIKETKGRSLEEMELVFNPSGMQLNLEAARQTAYGTEEPTGNISHDNSGLKAYELYYVIDEILTKFQEGAALGYMRISALPVERLPRAKLANSYNFTRTQPHYLAPEIILALMCMWAYKTHARDTAFFSPQNTNARSAVGSIQQVQRATPRTFDSPRRAIKLCNTWRVELRLKILNRSKLTLTERQPDGAYKRTIIIEYVALADDDRIAHVGSMDAAAWFGSMRATREVNDYEQLPGYGWERSVSKRLQQRSDDGASPKPKQSNPFGPSASSTERRDPPKAHGPPFPVPFGQKPLPITEKEARSRSSNPLHLLGVFGRSAPSSSSMIPPKETTWRVPAPSGTAGGPPFMPFHQRDPCGTSQYLTITFQQAYSKHSLEELRVADYKPGRSSTAPRPDEQGGLMALSG
ncbi:hypothetical protein BU23DRAFT_638387 [Bimuria novae-zelandiae CBS 107.79]|uniref:Major facilitator superfamily (MFS) profile domain-containing protein n=1 Tax=Bimuria novae-zelandiae CBS 107.79 TaxID=1447943 RepID=A0A6A5VBX8_9PLEO|nr:hypothetical protein BU23DRAFT_638387 [Bimuria novae-zelandiae CBS 107.79]